MSQRIVTAVFESYQPASKPAYLVALYLATKADDAGAGICVTVEEVSLNSRISLRTAREILAKMLEVRWLTLTHDSGSSAVPSVYAISPDWVAAHAK